MQASIFCIGLNVGAAEPAAQLTRTLRAIAAIPGDVRAIAQGAAAWQGAPERFLQVEVALRDAFARERVAAQLAGELEQACIAVLNVRANCWRLVTPAGEVSQGAPAAEYPVILPGWAPVAPAVNRPRTPDTVGHYSIQAWSAGEFFPAVIAMIEWPNGRRAWELTIGAFREVYATRDDAEKVARWACRNGRIVPERYAQLVA